MKQSSN